MVNEWNPSKYFNEIPLIDDDKGLADIVVYGPTTGQFITVANSESNFKRGLIKRMIYGGNRQLLGHEIDNPETISNRMEFFKWIKEIFIPTYISPLKPGYTFESSLEIWLKHCERYTIKTKENLRHLQRLILNGDYEAKYHGPNDVMGLSVINCFIKSENYTDVKEPRVISSCSQELKALLGGFYHLIDKHLINTTPFFVKGMNPHKITSKMEEMSKRWSCFMGSDYSSYEGSQDYDWLINVELQVYKMLLANYPEVYKFIESIYIGGHDLYYKKRYIGHLFGKRMSGDMQTSIGNGITNAAIWLYTAYKHNQGIEFLVEGDDAFLCSDSPLDVSIVNHLGFDCKIEGPSVNWEDIMFLSMQHYRGHSFANIYKILDKIGVVKSVHFAKCQNSLSKRQAAKLTDYMFTKAYCFLFMFPDTPIISTILSRICELCPGHFKIELMEDYYYTRIGKVIDVELYQEPSLEVRQRVQELYPLLPIKVQLRLEHEVKECSNLQFLIKNIFELDPFEKNLL